MKASTLTALLSVASDARSAERSNAPPDRAFALISRLAVALASADGSIVDLATPIETRIARLPSGRTSTHRAPSYVYRCGNDHTFARTATASRSYGRAGRSIEWIPSSGFIVCPVCTCKACGSTHTTDEGERNGYDRYCLDCGSGFNVPEVHT